jgi:hypothetical protein
MFALDSIARVPRRAILAFAVILSALAASTISSDANAAVTLGGTTVSFDTKCSVGWGGKYVNFQTYASGAGVQMQSYIETFDQYWRKTGSGYSGWGYMQVGTVVDLSGYYMGPTISPTQYVKVLVRFYKNGVTTQWMPSGHTTSNFLFGSTETNTGTYCKL